MQRSLLTSPSPNGTGLVQPACLSHWDKRNLFQYTCPTGTGCACPTGTSTTCANLLVPLGQVVFVPVACPSGAGLVQAPPFQSRSMTMSAKDVSEALPAHGFGVPDLYPERMYDDSHDKGYEKSETYTQCVVLSNKVCLVCCHDVTE